MFTKEGKGILAGLIIFTGAWFGMFVMGGDNWRLILGLGFSLGHVLVLSGSIKLLQEQEDPVTLADKLIVIGSQSMLLGIDVFLTRESLWGRSIPRTALFDLLVLGGAVPLFSGIHLRQKGKYPFTTTNLVLLDGSIITWGGCFVAVWAGLSSGMIPGSQGRFGMLIVFLLPVVSLIVGSLAVSRPRAEPKAEEDEENTLLFP